MKYRKKRKEKKKRNNNRTQKVTQTEQQIDYKVRLDARYKKRLSNSERNNVEPSEKNRKSKPSRRFNVLQSDDGKAQRA